MGIFQGNYKIFNCITPHSYLVKIINRKVKNSKRSEIKDCRSGAEVKRCESSSGVPIPQIDETNNRLNKLYEVIVRWDEHGALSQKATYIATRRADIERKLVA